MEDDGRLTCTTPAARCGAGACLEAVEVSINSEAFSSDGVEFTYHNATVSAVSVVSGPAFGGTALTVRGAGFVNLTGVESLCDFRDGRVVASFVDASTLLCTSPSAEVAGAAVSTSLDFSSAPANLTLYSHPPGVARVSDGVLWLTDVEFEQTGTAILPLPGASIMGEFFASFDLYAGGGSGGEGVSFNVGELPASYFDERGMGSGLSVVLRPSPAPVGVWYAGTLVAESTAARAGLSSAGFATVEGVAQRRRADGERVGRGALRERDDRRLVAVGVVAYGLRARVRASRSTTTRLVDNVHVRAGSAFRKLSVAVEVSLNGQSLTTDDAVAFSYFAAPAVSALRFERGPTSGGTSVVVTGSSFRGGSNYVCRFGAKRRGGGRRRRRPGERRRRGEPGAVVRGERGAGDVPRRVRRAALRVAAAVGGGARGGGVAERAAVHDERRDVRALRADPCGASAAARRAGPRRDGADGVRRGLLARARLPLQVRGARARSRRWLWRRWRTTAV